MRKKPVPLSVSLRLAQECMTNLRDKLESPKASCGNHRDPFLRISGETASNREDTPPHTASPRLECLIATAPHGFGLLFSLGFYRRESVCASGYH